MEEIRTKLKADLIEKYGSINQVIIETGIPRTTLHDYLSGKTKSMKDETRTRLYKSTGFDYLSQPFEAAKKTSRTKIDNKLELQLRNTQTSLDNIRTVIMQSNLSEEEKAEARESLILSDEQRARRGSDLFYAFLKEIHDFSESARKKFTKKVSEESAGYLISMVNFLYNPDKFKSWVGKANYPLKK